MTDQVKEREESPAILVDRAICASALCEDIAFASLRARVATAAADLTSSDPAAALWLTQHPDIATDGMPAAFASVIDVLEDLGHEEAARAFDSLRARFGGAFGSAPSDTDEG